MKTHSCAIRTPSLQQIQLSIMAMRNQSANTVSLMTSQATGAGKQLHFFDLPRELRDLVYEYVITDDSTILLDKQARRDKSGAFVLQWPIEICDVSNLLHTSRGLRHEAVKVITPIINKKIFIVYYDTIFALSALPNLEVFQLTITQLYLFEVLLISSSSNMQGSAPKRPQRLIDTFPNLQNLRISFVPGACLGARHGQRCLPFSFSTVHRRDTEFWNASADDEFVVAATNHLKTVRLMRNIATLKCLRSFSIQRNILCRECQADQRVMAIIRNLEHHVNSSLASNPEVRSNMS